MMHRRGFLKLLGRTALVTAVALTVPIAPCFRESRDASERRKFAMIEQLMQDAIRTHDDLIEQALFAQVTGWKSSDGLGSLLG